MAGGSERICVLGGVKREEEEANMFSVNWVLERESPPKGKRQDAQASKSLGLEINPLRDRFNCKESKIKFVSYFFCRLSKNLSEAPRSWQGISGVRS